MRTLGIDFGEKRIGLAISDPLGILATPIETLDSSEMDLVIPKLAETISDHTVTKIVVGIPWKQYKLELQKIPYSKPKIL